MNLFKKLSKQAKRLYGKAKKYKHLISTTAMNILVGSMIQIGILYLVHFSGILVESPRNIELLGMGAMLTAIIFPVTLIITSKIPIIRFRIYSNYRHGFNSVIGCLVLLLILGFISRILPNINTQAISLWIKNYIQPFNFLNHNRLWFNYILEIEMFLGVIYLILRIIWLAANPIKFRKRKSKNMYREARILIDSKDEDTIELLINELMSNFNYEKIVQLATAEPYLEFNTSMKKSLVPIKYTQELLDFLLDCRPEDNLFLQIVVKKRRDFLRLITYALKNEYKKNPTKVYVQLQKLFLINPIIEAFKLNDTLKFEVVLSIIFDSSSEKLDASNMILTIFKNEHRLGFKELLFNSIPIEHISPTDFGKYILITRALLRAKMTLDDLKALYSDIIFLQNLFGSLI